MTRYYGWISLFFIFLCIWCLRFRWHGEGPIVAFGTLRSDGVFMTVQGDMTFSQLTRPGFIYLPRGVMQHM